MKKPLAALEEAIALVEKVFSGARLTALTIDRRGSCEAIVVETSKPNLPTVSPPCTFTAATAPKRSSTA